MKMSEAVYFSKMTTVIFSIPYAFFFGTLSHTIKIWGYATWDLGKPL